MDDKPQSTNTGAPERPEGDSGPPGGTSLAAIVFVVLLIAGGIWLALEMYDNAR